ncbi:hypothetical protein [Haloferula sargassicola]|uniref:PEP-CTERM protein-sorting domain-containing protein n=1 Tax=Haloferula sargassicola TaxID=490096 RepID=A0ABP9USP0_9BACT
MKNLVPLLTLAVALPVGASTIATDDFESNSLSGGSGWSGSWSTNNSYLNGSSKVDGSYALGLYGENSTATRDVSPSLTTAGALVSFSWSLRADWDAVASGQIGVNLRESNGDTLATFKFVSGSSNLLVNDGGGDFGISQVSFGQGSIFDFTFSSEVGTNTYSFSATKRGTSETFSASNYTFSSRTNDGIGGIQFFVTAPSGSGNDGFIDSVSVSAVPEPTSFLAGLTLYLGLASRRRGGSR